MKRAFRAAESLDRFENTEENLLCKVLSLLAAVGEAEAQPVDLARVKTHEFFPGGFVAAQTSGNQAVFEAMVGQIAASGDSCHRAGKPAVGGCSVQNHQS